MKTLIDHNQVGVHSTALVLGPSPSVTRLLAALIAVLAAATPSQGADPVVIHATTVIDVRLGTARSAMTVIVEGGRITAVSEGWPSNIPEGAIVIDGSGHWVVPGYFDVHAHDSSDLALMRAVALGITTIHLMPRTAEASLASRQAARPASDPVPRIHLTPVLFTGTFPDNLSPGRYPVVTPDSAEEVRSTLAKQAAAGVKQIKIIQEDGRYWNGPDWLVPRLAPEVYDELVADAHRRGLRVYVHATQVEDTRQAIRAGADAFMHGTMDAALDDALIAGLRARAIPWTPAFRVVLQAGDPAGFARRVLTSPRLEVSLSAPERTPIRRAVGSTQADRPRRSRHTSLSDWRSWASTLAVCAMRALRSPWGATPGSALGRTLRWS